MQRKYCRLFLCALGGIIILILKFHFAVAPPEQLNWLLKPVVTLLGPGQGLSFTLIPGEGYLSSSGNVLIDSGCAGVNLLIIILALSLFTFPLEKLSPLHQTGAWFILVCASYPITIFVNTCRITTSLAILETGRRFLPLAGSNIVHMGTGVLYYAGSLFLYYQLLKRIHERI